MTAIAVPAARRRTLVSLTAGLGVTVFFLVSPTGQLADRNVPAHIVLETTATLVAGLVGLLLYGRYRRTGFLRDLLLVYAMAMLTVAASALVVVPEVVTLDPATSGTGWAAVIVRLLSSLFVLAASVVPARTTHRIAHPAREVVAVAAIVTATVAIVVLLGSALPDVVVVRLPAEASGGPRLDGHPVLLVVQAVHLACYGVAALRFTRASDEEGDDLLGWFGAAAAMGACARLNYLLAPSLYTQWFYAGDLLRLAVLVLLLVGAVREIRSSWAAAAEAAAETQRRLLARDLHDGLIQEIGYIRSQARGRDAHLAMGRIASAADRALHEAQRSLRVLTGPGSETLAAALDRTSAEMREQYDVPVLLSLEPAVAVSDREREELVRITREAVTNAIRHGAPRLVRVSLGEGVLTVSDDGEGFDPHVGRPGGFGLVSMRERAEAIGAVLRVESRFGAGTSVKVTW